MPILSRGFRTEPIAVNWTRNIVARGFRVAWVGHVVNNPIPPVPPLPPVPPSPGRRRRGGGGRFPRWWCWPEIPPDCIVIPRSALRPAYDDLDLEPDLPRQLSYRLAERLDFSEHAQVVIRLAWRLRKRS